MNTSDLDRLVRELCEEKISEGQPVRRAWLRQEILAAYPEPATDADFWLCCAGLAVGDRVDRFFRAEKNRDGDDTQQKLPGFEKLQRSYLITRDGESVFVPTEQLNLDELRSKAIELRAGARGLMAHADELDRYADARDAAAAE